MEEWKYGSMGRPHPQSETGLLSGLFSLHPHHYHTPQVLVERDVQIQYLYTHPNWAPEALFKHYIPYIKSEVFF